MDQTQWVEAYLRALELWFSRLDKRKISSIFFGGGTPSLLDPKFVELLIQKIDKLWVINSDCEISIEANPNSISEEKFKRLKDIGINRVSIGVQSLTNKDLKSLDFYLLKNGEKVQEGNPSQMVFDIDRIIEYVSKFMTLKKGDLIFTGTPSGVGKMEVNDVFEAYLDGRKTIDLRVK